MSSVNEVTVPLVVVSKFDVVNVHEYVTSVLNRSVSEGTLTVAIVAFAQRSRRLEEGNGGSSLRRLDAGGMAAASVEVRFAGALLWRCRVVLGRITLGLPWTRTGTNG